MAAAWIDERDAHVALRRARCRPAALDRAGPPRGALRLDARRASRSSSTRSGRRSARPRSARAASSRSWTARSSASGAAAPIAATARSGSFPPCARPTRAFVPRAPRRADGARLARSACERPVRADARRPPRAGARARGTGTPSRLRAGRRASGTPATRTGASRRARRASSQSAIFGRCPSSRASAAPSAIARSRRSSPTGHVEPGLPQRGRERAERVPDERLRRHRPAALLEVARGRRAPELLPELAELREQLLAGEEPPRTQAGRALRGVPRPEVLDHGLRMHARLGVRRELAHRRRAPEARGRGAKLGEDLLVRVAPAQARAKRGELRLVDPLEGTDAVGEGEPSQSA